MEKQVELLKKHPRKFYSLGEIQVLNLIPWARNYRTIRKLIIADMASGNLLKAIVTGDAEGARYGVMGGNIIKYLKAYGPALMATVRKSKHTYENSKTTSEEGQKSRKKTSA